MKLAYLRCKFLCNVNLSNIIVTYHNGKLKDARHLQKMGKVPRSSCLQCNRKARAAGGGIKRYANKRRLCVILVPREFSSDCSNNRPLTPRSQVTGNSSTEVRRKCDVTYVVAFTSIVIAFVRSD